MTRSARLLAFPILLTTAISSAALGAPAPAPNEFVLFADQTLRARGLVVKSGDVGANASVLGTKKIEAATSSIVGDSVSLDPASTCDELLANHGQSSAGCGPATSVSLPIIGDLATACGAPETFPACDASKRVFVAHGGTAELAPGTYGDVIVSGGGHGPGKLVLTGGTYTFCSLLVGRNGQVGVRAPSTINVVGSVKLQNGSNLRRDPGNFGSTSACDIHLFSNGAKVRISRRAAMEGVICAPNSKLEMIVGSTLFGAAYAREVKTDRVFLELPTCRTSGSTTTTTTVTTTSSSALPTSTSTTTSTTPTTGPCGNGVVDPSEPCDPSSPGGAFDCPEGSTCSAQCTCEGVPTTSTSTSTIILPTTSSSTSTTQVTATTSSSSTSTAAPTTSSSSTSTVAPTTSSSSTSTVAPTTSSSSTAPATTSSSSTSTVAPTTSSSSTAVPTTSTTATPTTTSTTTTTGGGVPATKFDFTSTAGSGICGTTFRDLAGTIPLKNLLCGNLSLGGGGSQVPDNTTPSGASNRFSLDCSTSPCTVGPLSPGTADYDCSATGCLFGTPLPISNAGLSVCVTNTFSQNVSGTLNPAAGSATLNFQLSSRTILTSTPTQPCPRCSVSVGGAACNGSPASPCTGVCDGSTNTGAACVSKNPNGLTSECPSPDSTALQAKCFRGPNSGVNCAAAADCPMGTCAVFIGDIPISLNPLTTGTTTKSSSLGTFCPGQTSTQKGAFKSEICQGTGATSGKPCTVPTAVADCGGGVTCKSGTISNICSGGTNDGKGCAINADCGTGGTCVKAGTLVQLIRATGSAGGALSLGVPKAVKLASVFCVGATTNGTVNGNANLPGPGATTLIGNITLLP